MTYRTVLAALDGSHCSTQGALVALSVARALEAELVLCHVHSDSLHAERFREMEPGLPRQYQAGARLDHLRRLHGSLILEGFEALSLGYLDALLADAQRAGVSARPVVLGGRHYVKLLEVAARHSVDLLVVGATGVGGADDTRLGGAASRVVRHAGMDVLVWRGKRGLGPILAAVDGSTCDTAVLGRAECLSRALDRPLELATVFDPDFHTEVFRAMGRALPAERQRQVGLQAQEELHDRLINAGLASMYQGFLERGKRQAPSSRAEHLLRGRAHKALIRQAASSAATLLVAGRHGHHREPLASIGFTAEALAGLSPCGVLLVAVDRAGYR